MHGNGRPLSPLEMVVLILVISIGLFLLAMSLPTDIGAGDATRLAGCVNNQNGLGKATIVHATRMNMYPASLVHAPDGSNNPWPLFPQIFPQLDKGDIFNRLAETNNFAANKFIVEVLICPSDWPSTTTGVAPLSYAANCGKPDIKGIDAIGNGIFFDRNKYNNPAREIIKMTPNYVAEHDGLAQTILFSENVNLGEWTDRSHERDMGIFWGVPGMKGFNKELKAPLTNATARPSSRHNGKFVVVFCDTHTRVLSEKIDPRVYARLLTPNGAAALPPDITPVAEKDLEF